MLWILLSIFVLPKQERLSTYGVTDKTKSVLVVENNSAFYIRGVDIAGEVEEKWVNLILHGDKMAYTIPPGTYTLTVHYSSRKSAEDYAVYYVSNKISSQFSVIMNRVVIFSLDDGKNYAVTYHPPDLNKK